MTRERLARIRALSLELAELTGAELREQEGAEAPPPPKQPRIDDLARARARRGLKRMGRLPDGR